MPGIVKVYSHIDSVTSLWRYGDRIQLRECLNRLKPEPKRNHKYMRRIHILPDDIPCDHIPTLEELKACINSDTTKKRESQPLAGY